MFRYGKPRSNEERRKRHKKKYGTSKLPPRGTGRKKAMQAYAKKKGLI